MPLPLSSSASHSKANSLLLQGIPVPSIELKLQELKRSRTRQFYGLMGKRVEGE